MTWYCRILVVEAKVEVKRSQLHLPGGLISVPSVYPGCSVARIAEAVHYDFISDGLAESTRDSTFDSGIDSILFLRPQFFG